MTTQMLLVRPGRITKNSSVRSLIVLMALLASTPVYSAEASKAAFRGKFAFNWFSAPQKTRCVRIGSKLMTLLSSPQFHCDPHGRPTSTGVRASVCTKADKSVEYLIFDTFAACENERQTQAANE